MTITTGSLVPMRAWERDLASTADKINHLFTILTSVWLQLHQLTP